MSEYEYDEQFEKEYEEFLASEFSDKDKWYTIEEGDLYETRRLVGITKDLEWAKWFCKEHNKLERVTMYIVSDYEQPIKLESVYTMGITCSFSTETGELWGSNIGNWVDDESEETGYKDFYVEGASYEECVNKARILLHKWRKENANR